MSEDSGGSSRLSQLLSRTGISRDITYFERKRPLAQREIMPSNDFALDVSEQFYQLNAPIEAVFNAYAHTPPAQVWPASRVVYHSVWFPPYDKAWQEEDVWPGIQEGMKLFCDLKVLPPYGALRIYVGVQVTRVEPLSCIRYDYLEDSVTIGYNELRFSSESGGTTKLHHLSEYRGTTLRDRVLMPLMQEYLHVGFVHALHRGMAAKIERSLPA